MVKCSPSASLSHSDKTNTNITNMDDMDKASPKQWACPLYNKPYSATNRTYGGKTSGSEAHVSHNMVFARQISTTTTATSTTITTSPSKLHPSFTKTRFGWGRCGVVSLCLVLRIFSTWKVASKRVSELPILSRLFCTCAPLLASISIAHCVWTHDSTGALLVSMMFSLISGTGQMRHREVMLPTLHVPYRGLPTQRVRFCITKRIGEVKQRLSERRFWKETADPKANPSSIVLFMTKKSKLAASRVPSLLGDERKNLLFSSVHRAQLVIAWWTKASSPQRWFGSVHVSKAC